MYALGALVVGIVLLYVFMRSVEGFDNKSPPLKSSNLKNTKVITIPLFMKGTSDIKQVGTLDPIIKNADVKGDKLFVTFDEKYNIHDFSISGLDKQNKLFLGNFDFGKTTPTLSYDGTDIRRDNITNTLKNAKFPINPTKQITIGPIIPDTFGGIDKLNNKEKTNINIDFLVSSK
jgi:hypothetical protein